MLGTGIASDPAGHLVTLVRATFEPGAGVGPHTHPGASVFSVDAGEITFGVVNGSALVTRAAGDGGSPEPEEVTTGAEVVLRAGDSIFYEGGVVVTDFNRGEEPAVVILTNVRPADAPGLVPVEATPAA